MLLKSDEREMVFGLPTSTRLLGCLVATVGLAMLASGVTAFVWWASPSYGAVCTFVGASF